MMRKLLLRKTWQDNNLVQGYEKALSDLAMEDNGGVSDLEDEEETSNNE